MRSILAIFMLSLSINSLASSVCIVSPQAGDSILKKGYINVDCDSGPTQKIELKTYHWNYSDVTPELQRLVSSGYNIVSQTTTVWTLQK